MLIRKSETTANSLSVVNDNQLLFNEVPVINQIKFWKKLNEYIDSFNTVDIESEKDELLNDKTIGFLDKIQFDLITLAKIKDLPFVSDDLMIRKICNNYTIRHTNTMQIVNTFSTDYDKYIEIFINFSKSNYIYTLYPNVLSEMLKRLYENFNEISKNQFLSIIKSVLKNKVCLDYYIPILLNRLENVKSVQYIQIFDQVYENLFATFVVDSINNIIESQCKKYGIDVRQYILK